MDSQPVIITAVGHPHEGEHGVLASVELAERHGYSQTADGTGRLVLLDNCPHGMNGCYVFPGEWRTYKRGNRKEWQ